MTRIDTDQNYRVNPGINYIHISNFDARKRMATVSKSGSIDPDIPRTYYLDANGRKIYHTEESKRLAEIRTASAQAFKLNMGINNTNINNTINNDNNSNSNDDDNKEVLPKQVTTSTSTSTSNIRDADISPLFFKIAARTFPKLSPSNNNLRQPPQQPDPNTIEDQKMAQYIVDNLKSNELSTGQEFTANDLENIIRNRFAGVNDN